MRFRFYNEGKLEYTIHADSMTAACQKLAERKKIRFVGLIGNQAYFSRRRKEFVYDVD